MKLVVIFAVLLSFPGTDLVDSEINVVLKHSTCHGNKKYIAKITSPRKPINRTTSITSLDIYFKPGVALDSPLYMQIIAYKKFTTQYRPFMIHLKFEFCNFLKFKSHPVYPMVLDHTKRTNSNVLEPCPYKGHRYAKPYYTFYNQIPALIPTGMWRVDYVVTREVENQEVEEVFRFQDYYEITPKGIIEF